MNRKKYVIALGAHEDQESSVDVFLTDEEADLARFIADEFTDRRAVPWMTVKEAE